MRRGVTLVLMGLAWAAPAGTVHAAPGGSYSGTGCREAAVAIPVDADRARAQLPPGGHYTPSLDATGRAVLGVAVMRCAALTVDGVPAGAGTLSDVGILVDSPEGGGWYQLWQHSDSGALHGRMASLGVAGQRAAAELEVSPGPLFGSHDFWGAVSPAAGGYEVAGLATAPAGDAPSQPVWWHEGRHGRVRLRYDITRAAPGAGAGDLTVAESSPLARLLGGESAVGAALLLGDLDFTAEATVTPR